MPKAIPGWVTEDGVVHTNHLSALKSDLALVLGKMADNEVGAKRISEKLTPELIDKITGYLDEIKEAMTSELTFSVVRDDAKPALIDSSSASNPRQQLTVVTA